MIERYSRQIQMKDIGDAGQKKLLDASVLVIGAGGLGSICIMDIAMMGIGHIGIIDYDVVKPHNLNRQALYTEKDIGKKKVVCALMYLQNLNSDIKVDVYDVKITKDNIDMYIKNYDYIVVATDNIESRLIINDACIENHKIMINGAIEGYNAIIQMIEPKKTPCIRCLYNDEKDDDKIKDAIAPPCSVVSAMMANILLLHIISGENVLKDNIMVVDLKHMTFDKVSIKKKNDCICA